MNSRRGRRFLRRAIGASALGLATCAGAVAAGGDLDPTFGDAGWTVTQLGSGFEQVGGLVVEPSGRVVVAGSVTSPASNPNFTLLRYTAAGALDAGFGDGGRIDTDFGSADFALAAARQLDGRIVVAGTTLVGTVGHIALARYTVAGELDATFGVGGKITTHVTSSSSAAARSVAVQPNGKIVVGGVGIVAGDNDFTVVRYLADGTRDATFGSGGIARIDLGSASDNLDTIEVLSDGKIVAAGSTSAEGTFDFAVVRLRADGSLDASFGVDGVALTDVSGGGDFVQAADAHPNGDIVVVGHSTCCISSDFQVVRYGADGNLDSSFGSDGIVVTDLGAGSDTPQGVAIRADGKIVVAGSSSGDIALARYERDGELDTGFGWGGIVLNDFGGSSEGAAALAVQPDGRIVVAGGYRAEDSFDVAVFAARYLGR